MLGQPPPTGAQRPAMQSNAAPRSPQAARAPGETDHTQRCARARPSLSVGAPLRRDRCPRALRRNRFRSCRKILNAENAEALRNGEALIEGFWTFSAISAFPLRSLRPAPGISSAQVPVFAVATRGRSYERAQRTLVATRGRSYERAQRTWSRHEVALRSGTTHQGESIGVTAGFVDALWRRRFVEHRILAQRRLDRGRGLRLDRRVVVLFKSVTIDVGVAPLSFEPDPLFLEADRRVEGSGGAHQGGSGIDRLLSHAHTGQDLVGIEPVDGHRPWPSAAPCQPVASAFQGA